MCSAAWNNLTWWYFGLLTNFESQMRRSSDTNDFLQNTLVSLLPGMSSLAETFLSPCGPLPPSHLSRHTSLHFLFLPFHWFRLSAHTQTHTENKNKSRLTEAKETGEDESVHIPGRQCCVYDRPALICVCASECMFVPWLIKLCFALFTSVGCCFYRATPASWL